MRDICPMPNTRTAVATARDSAIDRAAEAEGLDPERNARAAGLVALAIAIGARPYRYRAPENRRQAA